MSKLNRLLAFTAHLTALGAIAACSSTVTTTTTTDADASATETDSAVPSRDASLPPRDGAPPPPAPDGAPPPPPRDGGPPPPPPDGGPPPPDASTPDSGRDASTPDSGRDAGAPAGCYMPADALALTAATPSLTPSLCTAAQISGAQAACLGPGSSGPACNAFLAANTACSRCIFGALAGDDPATTPVAALIPVSDDAVVPNIGACAALVIGRPACAVPLAQEVVCTNSACATCADQAAEDACVAAASAGICSTVINAGCDAAIDAAIATWQPLCRGVAFADTYAKVAGRLCGPP